MADIHKFRRSLEALRRPSTNIEDRRKLPGPFNDGFEEDYTFHPRADQRGMIDYPNPRWDYLQEHPEELDAILDAMGYSKRP